MRREGLIPGILYGKSAENVNLKVSAREFHHLLSQSASENVLIDLDIEGEKKLALIQQVQHDPLSGGILHADFHAVSETEKLSATVPVELTGSSPGVKAGGIADLQLHEVHVRCLPKDLPEILLVDISSLELGDSLHVSELAYPEGVEPDTEGSVVVVLVTEPRVSEEEEGDEEGEAKAGSEPEVLREKKEAAESEG